MRRITRITRIPGLRRFFKLDRPSDVDDEIQFHIDARVDDLVRLGADPEHARRQALVEFGDTKRYHDETLTIDREYAREVRMKELLASVWSDLGYALRGLRRSPG